MPKTLCVTILAISLLSCGDSKNNNADGGGGSDSAVGPGALSGQQLMEACVRASACRVKTYPALANCVDAYHNLFRPQGLAPIWDKIYRCVNAAGGDCKAIEKCFDYRGTCDSSYKASCEGKRAVSCDLIDGKVYGVNCADANLDCAVKKGSTFEASCTPGECYSSLGNLCKGDSYWKCNLGLIEIDDCSLRGMKCVKDQNVEGCQGNQSQTCKANEFSAYCNDAVAVTCELGRKNHQDCTKMADVATSCNAGSCAVGGSECDHTKNRCQGSQLEACIDGRWRLFDCQKLGLEPCKDSGTHINCAPPSL
jgi:hypothetical protein